MLAARMPMRWDDKENEIEGSVLLKQKITEVLWGFKSVSDPTLCAMNHPSILIHDHTTYIYLRLTVYFSKLSLFLASSRKYQYRNAIRDGRMVHVHTDRLNGKL
jgi:hypothetical protein